jgi:hypothetical protein
MLYQELNRMQNNWENTKRKDGMHNNSFSIFLLTHIPVL